MKKLLKALLMAVAFFSAFSVTAKEVNLLPKPQSVNIGNGELALDSKMSLGCVSLPADMKTEVNKFAASLKASTGLKAKVKNGQGTITVKYVASVPAEGYTLSVTPSSAEITASDAAGLFYAFQTVKQLLGANVLAEKPGTPGQSYALPEITVTDSPRFPYRGFMLDVSRHFFDAQELKKMLDVMSMYKLNRFHWHLTDDQGWRLPVPGYPKLIQEGAIADNVLRSDFSTGKQHRDGEGVAYGPFAYTEAEIRDIVKYAADRHIQVLPEIDMPGHMVAAIHAYPEFSTDPQSKLVPDSVAMDSQPIADQAMTHFTHNIWNHGGVSRDVLDVSNPNVMKFMHDVVDQLAALFPYEYIHIGGDECPTLAWKLSDNCQKMKNELGLTDDRALQTWFTNQIAAYAREKHGKKIMGWNELISEDNIDMNAVKELNPVIMCWVDAVRAANKAQKHDIDHIYTNWSNGYYINRSYRDFDKIGAGRDGSVAQTFMNIPPANDKCIGVQGTFWTEQVDRNEDLEYLTLPRLLVIAEHGWSPAGGEYEEFMERLSQQAPVLETGGYNYGKHQIPVRHKK